MTPLFKAVVAALILAGCGSNGGPADNDPPPSWCARVDADSGQRYYMPCEDG